MSVKIIELRNGSESDKFVKLAEHAIIFFGSKGCSHCRSIKPYVDSLVAKFPNINFGHVETSTVRVEGLRGVPTFISYVNGKKIDTVIGADEKGLLAMCKKIDSM